MSRRTLGLTILAMGAVLITAPVRVRAAISELSPGDTLTVYFTAETHGNLEPCSCPERQLGGLARRVAFLAQTHGKKDASLRLDAGGFLPIDDVPLRDDPAVATRFVKLLLRGLERSHYDAIALDLGQRQTLTRMAQAEARVLAGGWMDANPVAPPRLFKWNDTGVALLTVAAEVPSSVQEIAAADAREHAAGIPGVTRTLLIVMARANASDGRSVARATSADLVVLSLGARPKQALREGASVLVGAGMDGREVGEIKLTLDDGHWAFGPLQLHAMDSTQPEDPEIALSVEKTMTEDGVALRASVLSRE
ncbi:MAG: hypothetical protein U0527_02885 [Candidatus Eisenbacteria bacterium]